MLTEVFTGGYDYAYRKVIQVGVAVCDGESIPFLDVPLKSGMGVVRYWMHDDVVVGEGMWSSSRRFRCEGDKAVRLRSIHATLDGLYGN